MNLHAEHPQGYLEKLLAQKVTAAGKLKLSAINELCERLGVEMGAGITTNKITSRCVELGLLRGDGQMYRNTTDLVCIKLINCWVKYLHSQLALNERLDSPKQVFSRLMMSVQVKSQVTLLKIQQICVELYDEGHRDFRRSTIREHLAARNVLQAASMLSESFKTYYELTDCWDAFANPHYTPVKVLGRAVRKSADVELGWYNREHPQYEQWRLLAVEWLKSGDKKGLQQTLQALSLFLTEYLVGFALPADPLALLNRAATVPSFWGKVASKRADSGATYANKISEFIDWVLLKLCSDLGDDGVLYVSSLFRNPFAIQSGERDQDSHSMKATLPYAYISELQSLLAQGPNFRDWVFAQQALGVQPGMTGRPATDWYDVPESLIDKSDPDCVWRKIKRGPKRAPETVYQIWSPVRWVCLLAKLQVPLRTGQIRLLDSGEADSMRYDNGVWGSNTNPLASENKLRSQGALCLVRGQLGEADTTHVFVNTNKTADQGKSGPEKGYVMPWIPFGGFEQDIFHWLEKLRNWQEKYNPVTRLTAWTELDARHLPPKFEGQLRTYEDTCFLFRTAELVNYENPHLQEVHLPVSAGAVEGAWASLLEEFEAKVAGRGDKHESGRPIEFVVRKNEKHVTPMFSLHGLRVSLITALAIDGEVPIHILMKVVGHSRLLMSIYYVVPGGRRIALELKNGAERLAAKREQSLSTFLAQAEHDTLLKEILFKDRASLSQVIPIHPSARNPVGWMPLHLGICLAGGNVHPIEFNAKVAGCFNGGEKSGLQLDAIYLPVPGGAKNCIRCRWFATDPTYLGELVAHFNIICSHVDEARFTMQSAELALQAVRREKAEIENSGLIFTHVDKLIQAERMFESTVTKFEGFVGDWISCIRYIQRCEAMLNAEVSESADGKPKRALIAGGNKNDLRMVLEETSSELLQLSAVCDAAEILPETDVGTAVLRRSQLLDSALCNEGYKPIFLRLTKQEQLSVGNRFLDDLARLANPDEPFLGKREVVSLMDLGKRVGDVLGINLEDVIGVTSENKAVIDLNALVKSIAHE